MGIALLDSESYNEHYYINRQMSIIKMLTKNEQREQEGKYRTKGHSELRRYR